WRLLVLANTGGSALHGPVLQHFGVGFRHVHGARGLPDRASLIEAQLQHSPVIGRQERQNALQLTQQRRQGWQVSLALRLLERVGFRLLVERHDAQRRAAPPVVGEVGAGDSKQVGLNFLGRGVRIEILQALHEDVRSEVLGVLSVADPGIDEAVDRVEKGGVNALQLGGRNDRTPGVVRRRRQQARLIAGPRQDRLRLRHAAPPKSAAGRIARSLTNTTEVTPRRARADMVLDTDQRSGEKTTFVRQRPATPSSVNRWPTRWKAPGCWGRCALPWPGRRS